MAANDRYSMAFACISNCGKGILALCNLAVLHSRAKPHIAKDREHNLTVSRVCFMPGSTLTPPQP
jgi:hypothetical protein